MHGKNWFGEQVMSVVLSMRRWAVAAAAVASISSITWSEVLAATVSSYTQVQADRGKKAYDAMSVVRTFGTIGSVI